MPVQTLTIFNEALYWLEPFSDPDSSFDAVTNEGSIAGVTTKPPRTNDMREVEYWNNRIYRQLRTVTVPKVVEQSGSDDPEYWVRREAWQQLV